MSDKNQLTLNHDASCYSEQLTANLVGKCRTENVDGVKYLVAKIAALNPGVLNGSRGPLLYTPEDTRRATKSWNNVPLVVYHPTDNNGHPISAKTDGVVHVGFTKNANYNGKLSVEGWFDIEKTKTTDSRVYAALVNGTPMEVSTGLGTTNEEAPAGASYLGQLYSHIARNHKPDHLALLPDQRGACSLNDGCGLHVNQASETTDDSLCTNCDASGECSECKAKRLKKAPVENEEETVENEEESVEEEVRVENCGGKGGKPGVCKTSSSSEHDVTGKAIATAAGAVHVGTTMKPNAFGNLIPHHELMVKGGLHLAQKAVKSAAEEHGLDVAGGSLTPKEAKLNAKDLRGRDVQSHAFILHNESSHDDLSQQVTDFFNRTGTHKMVTNREFLKTLNCGGTGGTPGPCPTGQSASRASKAAEKLTDKARKTNDPKDHEAAYHAHGAALTEHLTLRNKTTNDKVYEKHDSAVEEHRSMQAHHMSGEAPARYTGNQSQSSIRSLLSLVANSDTYQGVPIMAGKLSDTDRQKLVDGLITNSGFEIADIYSEEDTEVLNAMSDEKLFKAALAKQTLIDQQTVVNQVSQITGERNVENMANAIQNAFKPFKKKAKDEEDDEEMDDEYEGETMNSDIRVPRQMTEAEFMKMAPPSIRADLEFSRATQNKEKQELIGSITANVSGDDLDQAVNYLRTKPLPELRIIANMASKPAAPEFDVNIRRSVNYGGMAVPTGNRPTTNKRPGEGPKPVVINWAELSKNNAG